MKRLTLLTLFCISNCFGGRLVADSNLVSSPVIVDSATLSDTALINETFSNLIPQGVLGRSAYALASFGQLGVSTTAGFSLTQVLGGGSSGTSASAISSAGVSAEDFVQLAALPPDQRLYLDIELEGILSANPSSLNTVNLSSVAEVDLNVILGASSFRYRENPDGASVTGSGFSQIGAGLFRIWTPVNGGGVGLFVSLRALANCSGTIRNYADQPAAIACNAIADYSHTLRFLGAGLADASGNAIGPAPVLTSGSGFNYVAGVPPAPTGEVPEPATAALIGGSLAALALFRRLT